MGNNAGTNINVATNVHPRDINSNNPILAVPGWAEAAKDPKAVPVVKAENRTALAVGDDKGFDSPSRQFITK